MDDLNLLGKNKEQIESLNKTVHVFSQDIGMEFELKKWAILILRTGKIYMCDGIVLPDGEVVKEGEQEGNTYLVMLELDRVEKVKWHCTKNEVFY